MSNTQDETTDLGDVSFRQNGNERERFSGLRITGRQVPARRWDDLMRGKRFVTFSSLVSSVTGTANDNFVAIGVVYDKSLPKTSANGNRFANWSVTDLSFPQPRIMTLLLYGEAFEAWEADASKTLARGSILALLNPVPLTSREPKDKVNDETRAAVKVTHATQIVFLGSCPSLGFCTCKKKDGTGCSMPCDKDRGALVCYYHTMAKEAEKIRHWSASKASDTSQSKTSSSGIYVLPSSGSTARSKVGSSTPDITQTLTTRPRPLTSQSDGKETAALRRLLLDGDGPKTKTSRPQATPLRSTTGAPTATQSGNSQASSVPASPLLPFAASQDSTSSSSNTSQASQPPSALAVFAAVNASAAAADAAHGFAVRKILRSFPQGIPAPNPNNLTRELSAKPTIPFPGSEERSAKGPSLLSSFLTKTEAEKKAPQNRFGGGAVPSRPKAPSVEVAASTVAANDKGGSQELPASGISVNDKGKGPKVKAKKGVTKSMIQKWEAEFGKKIALQLAADNDPTKDLVRMQNSRFQGVIEQERAAKRARRLEELEVEDTAQEKMETLTFILVNAYRCQNCSTTYDSDRSRIACQEQGHNVNRLQVKRTRWECSNCRQSYDVLDRELPSSCSRCNGIAFKQVPLRRARSAAPMERDLLLARGEELPFLNSIHIPGLNASKRFKEAKDDYEGL